MAEFQNHKKIGDPSLIVPIGESLLRGKKEFNRLLLHINYVICVLDEVDVVNNRNEGNLIQEPYIFNLCYR